MVAIVSSSHNCNPTDNPTEPSNSCSNKGAAQLPGRCNPHLAPGADAPERQKTCNTRDIVPNVTPHMRMPDKQLWLTFPRRTRACTCPARCVPHSGQSCQLLYKLNTIPVQAKHAAVVLQMPTGLGIIYLCAGAVWQQATWHSSCCCSSPVCMLLLSMPAKLAKQLSTATHPQPPRI
jgi:hypothetical protein